MDIFSNADRKALHETLAAFFEAPACNHEFVIVAFGETSGALAVYVAHNDDPPGRPGAALMEKLRSTCSAEALDVELVTDLDEAAPPLPIRLNADQRETVAARLRGPLQIIMTSMELALEHPDPDEDLHRKRAALLATRQVSHALKELFAL